MSALKGIMRAAVLLSAMGAMNALLRNVQVEGRLTGDVESIAWGISDPVARTTTLLQTWAENTRPLTSHVMWTYFFVDLAFIAVYVGLVHRLWQRLDDYGTSTVDSSVHRPTLRALSDEKRWFLIGGLAVADVLENTGRLVLFLQVDTSSAAPWTWLIVVTYACTTVKFALVLTPVWAVVEWVLFPAFRRKLWQDLVTGLVVAWRMRVAVTAVVMFGAALLFDVTGQVADLLLRWAEDGSGFLALGIVLLATSTLGLTVRITTRRLVQNAWKQSSRRPVPSALFLVVGLALFTLAAKKNLSELNGPAWVLFVIGAVGLGWELWAKRHGDQRDRSLVEARKRRVLDARKPRDEQIASRVPVLARALIVAPFVVLVLAATKAYTPVPFVLHMSGTPSVFALCLLALAVAVVPRATDTVLRRLRDHDQKLPANVPLEAAVSPWSLPIIGLALAVITVVTLVVVNVGVHWISAVPVLAVYLAAMMLLLCELQRIAEAHAVPAGLLVFGFSRIPVALLLVVCAAVSSLSPFDDGSGHAVRHNNQDPPPPVHIEDLWAQWKKNNCADDRGSREVLPLVLVSSYGGGQRAAYWTASSLTELFRTKTTAATCPRRAAASAVFALGGASGGSLGNTAWAVRDTDGDWYHEALAQKDFLTEPITWMLTVDLARSVTGIPVDDRAARLEKQFEQAIPAMDQDFLTLDNRPLLMLTGTQVENGCRLSISRLRLTTGGSCTDGTHGTNAAVTTDLLDYTCDADGQNAGSVSRSTAALLSARFPYVSPSGQLYRCGNGSRIAVVDGGYSDNTGIDAMLELWHRLAPLVAAHNQDSGHAVVAPVFVVVDNHYRTIAKTGTPKRTQELQVPLNTTDAADQLDELASEQRAREQFTGPLPGHTLACTLPQQDSRLLVVRPVVSPGLQAPLAWSLSKLAVEDLDTQRQDALDRPAVRGLTHWLAGADPCRPIRRGATIPG